MNKLLPVILLPVFCLFFSFSSKAVDRYWVGGTGDWNDLNSWAAASNGVGGVSIPTAIDDVFFDVNSGLNPATIVNMNVAVDIRSIDFSGVATSFIFNSTGLDVTIRGSITGNVAGAAFTGIWAGIDLITVAPGQTLTSGGTVWVQDFTTLGDQISILDDFDNGNASFQIDSGGVDLNGNVFECGTFISLTNGDRIIDIANAEITINSGAWSIDSTNLTWTAGSSIISLGDNGTGLANFFGGSLPYDTLESISATNISYFGNNSFDLVDLIPSSTFRIRNGDSLIVDSLIASGTCLSRFFFRTTGPGPAGVIQKTGFNTISLTGLDIDNVNAGLVGTYNLSFSALQNALGWTNSPAKFFWFGNGGDWNDVAHWSFTSGGPLTTGGCLPFISDSVFFDVNSFTLT
ncbi:MAG: hypothetical protein AB8B56_10645, partial [Crocinitomicaceae bacterium]